DALLEQLAVEFEADGGDVAALLRAEQVSRAPDFKIAHGDFESAAEGGVLFYGGEAFANVRQQTGMAWEQKVGVSLVLVPADAAAQLVEIAEAETVGAIDNNCVGIGNIEAAFDNRG